jgi:hypothetical protein
VSHQDWAQARQAWGDWKHEPIPPQCHAPDPRHQYGLHLVQGVGTPSWECGGHSAQSGHQL